VRSAKQVFTVVFSNKESSKIYVTNFLVESVTIFYGRGSPKCHRDYFLQVFLCCDFY